jgi:hypothetical protein
VFDVHRLKLLQLMRVELPPNLSKEKELNQYLMALWQRNIMPDGEITYAGKDTDVAPQKQTTA